MKEVMEKRMKELEEKERKEHAKRRYYFL